MGVPEAGPATKSPEAISTRIARLVETGAFFFVAGIALVYVISGPRQQYIAPAPARHCDHLGPITAAEFQIRQNSLARVLNQLNASAYITEPGASSLYYANISTSNWSLSERPLLLIITPQQEADEIEAKVSILTPVFEATRAKMLPIASDHVTFTEWAEESNPYDHAMSILSRTPGSVYVDGSTRTFIVDGLRDAHPHSAVSSAPYEIRRIRERKSPAEIELLKCANEATVLSIRAVHKKLHFGIRESTASAMMRATLASSGLNNGGCLTLFGENAALPHGAGTDRALGKHDFALFDCTANLHGYQSDVTRTVALPGSVIPEDHLQIWHDVRAAQNAAISTAYAGVVAAEVDKAARSSLENSNYFTHRLGHGIGLEVHEAPYLKRRQPEFLRNEVSTTEYVAPGIYIEGKVGVRLEDCFYISETGSPVFLTAEIGGQAKSPWRP
ncbi:peptidase M24, structural domain-containing protein [Mycena filopes]|nr:peptidase M24, structural domain-containing protein [Mycena filopes]